MHVEVLEFPLVKLHELLVLKGPVPAGLFVSRVDVDDLAGDLVSQQMHLLFVFVHEVTHFDTILQIVVVLLFMVDEDLVYQLIGFFLVEARNLFAGGRKNGGVKIY
jgi:hypothetical protein